MVRLISREIIFAEFQHDHGYDHDTSTPQTHERTDGRRNRTDNLLGNIALRQASRGKHFENQSVFGDEDKSSVACF